LNPVLNPSKLKRKIKLNSINMTTITKGNSLRKILGIAIMLIIVSVFALPHQARATHAAGSDLTYKCLGGNTYLIEVTFYRDCAGIAEPTNVDVNYKSTSLNVNLTATATKIPNTGQEITVPCATSLSTCNGGTGTGIRKFVYQATVTLPNAASDWVFSYHVCCRNCSITTIQNPCANSTEIYVESTLNNVRAPGNSSPVFSNIPIAFVCMGQTFNYNHGVLDANGDSLSYSLITPKISATQNVTFIAPNSVTTPIQSSTPFTLNAVTGQLTFTPNQQQIGVLAILVKEYRNGLLIGSVIRDMQIYTTPCSNNLPTASGINGTTNYSMTVCPNVPVCFNITTADADASQVVTVTTNNGIQNGTYTIGTGNRPTVNFCWTPTNADIDLAPHTFTVTVRDNACPSNGVQTYSYNIYVPSPYYSLTSTNLTCNGVNNGSAMVVPTYGGNYTYLWNTAPAQTTQTAVNLAPGTYSVIVTDASTCSATQSVTITQPTAINSTVTQTNLSCAGICTGAINLSTSGGTGSYNYNWSNGSTTQNVSNLCAGNYTVTITDGSACTAVKNATLTNISNISATVTAVSNATCYGTSTGSATLTVTGGIAPYSYLWSNGATTKDLNGVASGTYTVTVTDGNSCVKTASVTISQPSASLNGSISSLSNVSCFGGSNGSVNLTVNGGTAPYSYNWSNGSTNEDQSNLLLGNYTVTVTDANGCVYTNSSVLVSQPPSALNGSVSSSNNISCFGGSNGSISLAVNGGTAPYSYNWSNGATTQNISNIAPGTYTVSVTDVNGCSTVVSGISITQPAAGLNLGVNTVSNVSCFGGSNGNVSLNVTGGTAPYSYNWSNGSTLQNLNNVPAGNYSVTVTDANGCNNNIAAITVGQPGGSLNSAVSSLSNVSCNSGTNGAINLSVNGGTAPYTFSWSNGATTQNLNGITAGNYSVIITDAHGCTALNSGISIQQPASPLNGSVSSSGNVNCFGGSNGSINLSVNGGTAPYSYVWSNGAITQNISNLASGTYTVTVTDVNGCNTVVSGISITQPSAGLNSSVSSSGNVNCFGGSNGSINLTVNGGTAPYSYNWSNGSITEDLNNLVAGSYNVVITDANGCTNAISGIVISQPAAGLNANVIASSNVSCFGGSNGSLILNVTGGTAPYSYNWSNGSNSQNLTNVPAGTYSVLITDAKGCVFNVGGQTISQPPAALSSSVSSSTNVSCFGNNSGSIILNVSGGTAPYTFNWSNGAITQNLSNIPAGNYAVTITDANGCSTAISSIVITQPAGALNGLAATTQNVSCNSGANGTVTLTVNGGTLPYTFVWSNGATTQNISGLYSGSYIVTVTDAQGCTFTTSATVAQPSGALASTINVSQNVNCFGGNNGSIILNVTGGTTPYSYNWSNGATTQNIAALSSGTYTVTIADANGCVNVATASVQQPSASLNGSASSTSNVSCFGGSNGNIDLTVNGGTVPYSYEWNNGASTQDISNLAAGTYTVSVTDANGCTTAFSGIAITQPAGALNDNASSVTNVSCFGGTNGGINLTVNGGTQPYSYAWSNGANTQNITNIVAGSYTVTVTDVNGCTTQVSGIAVDGPAAALNANTSSTTAVSCFGGNNGDINLSVNGGTAPYSYNWSNGATTQNISNLTAGNYSVLVTDLNGCTTIVSGIAITQPGGALTANAIVSQNVNCFSGANGSIDLTVTGGTAPYTFSWNTGANTEDLNNLNAGTYTVNIVDVNGCSRSATATVIQPSGSLSASANVTQNVSCYAGANGSIDVNVNGGTLPYIYNWSNGANTEDLSNLAAGTYVLTIIDANGCAFTDSALISQPVGALSGSATATQNVSCNSGANGAIDLTIIDGTAPYSFNWSNGETTEDLSNLFSGTYNVTVIDANGCTFNTSATVTQPAGALNASVNASQNVSCFAGANGSIDLTAADGTAPYSYNWSNGETTEDINNLSSGNYTVTVTDANGCFTSVSAAISQPTAALNATVNSTQNASCYASFNGSIDLNVADGTAPYSYNWSNGETTEDISNLSAGIYNVTVTDVNGCSTNASATITQPSAVLNASVNSTQNASCYSSANGSIDLNVTDGTAPYSYNWSNGAITEDLNNLSAGTYNVTVTDANGCSTNASATITQPSAALNATVNSTQNASCYASANGSIDLNVTDGTAPYSYNWSNGAITEDLNNLSAGTYNVTVTDANGCSTNASATITQPSAALNATVNSTQNASCYASANGSIDLNVTDGTAPYSYNWSNGAITEDINNLLAGTYNVTVTDANGCSTNASAIITQPLASLSVAGSGSTANCLQGVTGNVNINVNGGTVPFTYSWNSGATSQNLTGVGAGSYTVTVTDANGCSTQGNYVVTDNSSFSANANGPTEVCMGDLVTLVADSVSGATYQWYMDGQILNGANSNVFVTPAAGSYTVTITSVCGNFVSDPIVVKVHSVDNISTSPNVIVCPGESTQLLASGGTNYSWSPSNGLNYTNIPNPIATPSQATQYVVTITNDFGCKTTATIDVAMCDTLIIPSGYSPNNDVVNDYFVIKGIEHYPGNKIWIYNRWGNLIYKAHDYDNKWDGYSNVSGIYIGKRVPPGTYFYVLDLNVNSKPLQGYVVIRY
jgi:gliding motility-associated-like protein